MKKTIFARIGLAFCLAIGMCSLPVTSISVLADESTTVQGTVREGTTSSLLLLATPQGNMEIKIDSSTDTSGCKLLLTGKSIYATVYYGSDAYMHASKITSTVSTTAVQLDTSSQSTVSGTIKNKSTDELLYVSTPQGDMEIKMDSSTDLSGVSVLVAGKTYSITCVRGNDAYMHAVRISDASAAPVASYTTNYNTGNISGVSVSGTVSKNTTPYILYLNTGEGEMQFKLDNTTDTLRGMVHVKGNPLTVYYTHGSDGYLHATTVIGNRTSSNASVDTSSTSTVVGTVDGKSTESLLYLSTQYGMMEIKLDSVTSLNGSKALTADKVVSVTCAYGSDAYMHAISITG